MKKIYLSIIATLFAISFSYAQWSTVGTVTSTTNTVGIGTTTPNVPLNLYGTGDVGLAIESSIDAPYLSFRKAGVNEWLLVLERNTPDYGMSANDIGFLKAGAAAPSLMIQQSTGNVGIGTTTPGSKLTVAESSGINTYLTISNNAISTLFGAGGTSWGLIGTSSNHDFGIYTNNTEKMRVTSSGNILIGQTSQVNSAYKLDVAGYARANEVVVNTTGADFVFDPSYKLNSISTLKKYIEKNHHLPEIPSAKQMQQDGLSVGENQIKLLQKVEELTLYLIEKDKQLNSLKTEVDQLKKQVSTLIKFKK